MIFKARTKSLNKITDKIFELVLVHDNELFYFNAGQYVWIETKYGRRAFSISSSSTKPAEITILFRAGIDSSYMNYLSLLKAGDPVNIIGPRGVLRAPDEATESIYLAGGVGITPFLSIIRSLHDKNISRDITLVSVNSTTEDEIFKEELNLISKNDPNFKLINIVGKVTEDALAKIRKNKTEADWYVIGSQGFVDASNDILNKLKINSDNIFFEENFPSVADLDVNTNKEGFFKKITDESAIHIVVTDANGVISYANQAAEKMTGYKMAQIIGNTPRLWGGLMDKETYVKFWQTIKFDKKVYIGELRNIRANGDEYDVLATVTPILEGGKLVGFLGMEQDITEDKKNKNELKKIRDLMIDRVLENDKKL
jgi:PAS domain S-box-containing protein